MAIALDAASDGGYTAGTSHSFPHTNNGNILFVPTFRRGGSATSVTYNGVSMTSAGTALYVTIGGDYLEWFYLASPATGANTVAITGTGASFTGGSALSYNSSATTGIPDAYYSNYDGSASSHTGTVTTSADNCWGLLIARTVSSGTSTAGTGSTARANCVLFQTYDSNGPKTPAGSFSMSFTAGTTEYAGVVMLSFAPSGGGGGGGTVHPRLSLMGVGN